MGEIEVPKAIIVQRVVHTTRASKERGKDREKLGEAVGLETFRCLHSKKMDLKENLPEGFKVRKALALSFWLLILTPNITTILVGMN